MLAIRSRTLVAATLPGLSGLLRLAIMSRTLPRPTDWLRRLPPPRLSSSSAASAAASTAEYSPDFRSTPTMLQGRGLGWGRGLSPVPASSTAGTSVFFAAAVDSKVEDRRPMMEEEECLMVSVSPDFASWENDLWRSGGWWVGEGAVTLVDITGVLTNQAGVSIIIITKQKAEEGMNKSFKLLFRDQLKNKLRLFEMYYVLTCFFRSKQDQNKKRYKKRFQ